MKLEVGALQQQLSLERQKYADLEILIQNERRQNHDQHFSNQDINRKNKELLSEVDRLKLRIESLESHIDTL